MLKKLFVEVQDMAVGITLPENGNESEAIALDTERFGICERTGLPPRAWKLRKAMFVLETGRPRAWEKHLAHRKPIL